MLTKNGTFKEMKDYLKVILDGFCIEESIPPTRLGAIIEFSVFRWIAQNSAVAVRQAQTAVLTGSRGRRHARRQRFRNLLHCKVNNKKIIIIKRMKM